MVAFSCGSGLYAWPGFALADALSGERNNDGRRRRDRDSVVDMPRDVMGVIPGPRGGQGARE